MDTEGAIVVVGGGWTVLVVVVELAAIMSVIEGGGRPVRRMSRVTALPPDLMRSMASPCDIWYAS